jgi:hypothetical protein
MTANQEMVHLPFPASHITVCDKPIEENDMAPTATLIEGPIVAPPVILQQSFT